MEIGDAVKADCKVEKIDSFYTVLKRTEMLTVNVEELNYLAKRLDSFDTGEAAQFQAMAHKLELFELKDLINLSEAFSIDCTGLFNDLRCNLSMNPIEPRFLKEHCYDTFYLNSAKGAIGGGIHEIIHFIWFYVWNQLFGDNYDEYERPSLKWILSEMVVESVMRDERLSSINPYFPRENGGCVYPYFFDMMVGGQPILDTLDTMYRNRNIEDFMRISYVYCQEHESEIREHILKSEG